MKTESHHEELKEILAKTYGKPSFTPSVVDYYANQRISLRTKPNEISFHSNRVDVEYDGYMKSLE